MLRNTLSIFLWSTLLLGGCAKDPLSPSGRLRQPGLSANGLSANGLSANGLSANGLSANGLGSQSFTTTGGMQFNGLGATAAGTFAPGIGPDWNLTGWITNNDLDADGFLMQNDQDIAVKSLEYWARCACAPGFNITLTYQNPLPPGTTDQYTFTGASGMGTGWCSGTGPVSDDERGGVSVCLTASINTLNIHNRLSIRSYDSGNDLGDNEGPWMTTKTGSYAGDFWGPTDDYPDNGNFYPKLPAYACWHDTTMTSNTFARDISTLAGRECEWNGCGGFAHTMQSCYQDGDPSGTPTGDGASSTGQDMAGNTITTWDPPIRFPGPYNTGNSYSDQNESSLYMQFRGRDLRQATVYLGTTINLSGQNMITSPTTFQCNLTCTPGPGCMQPTPLFNCSYILSQVISGTAVPIGASQFVGCANPADCVAGDKLSGLTVGQQLQMLFQRGYVKTASGWTPIAGSVNHHKPAAIAIRYANGWSGPLRMKITDPSGINPDVQPLFLPTGSWDTFQTITVFPFYATTPTAAKDVGVTLTLEADPIMPPDPSPDLDYVLIYPGPAIGQQSREMYDNLPFPPPPLPQWISIPESPPAPPAFAASLTVPVPTNSGLGNVNAVRIRPSINAALLSELQIDVVTPSGLTINVLMPGAPPSPTAPWLNWVPAGVPAPAAGNWTVNVYDRTPNGSSGQLTGVLVEFQGQ